jgi:hypothetical protein
MAFVGFVCRHELDRRDRRYGVMALCVGGEGIATMPNASIKRKEQL